jgi:sugar lactone lactonase YvrE
MLGDIMDMKPTILTNALRFAEGPRWHDGKLWFCDYFTRKVMHVDLDGNVETVLALPDMPSAIGWSLQGRLLVVSSMNRRLLELKGDGAGALEEVADFSGLVSYPCSDMVIDGQGRAYIASIGFEFGNPQAVPKPGSILLVATDGTARIIADGLAFPNGMVITPDGKTLIAAESHAARLTAFNIAPDGSLSTRRAWAQFEDRIDYSEGKIAPDGICLDAEGAVWLASPSTREVLHTREGAQITHRIPVDAIPLACMLGGPQRRTLFIGSTESLDPRDTNARGRIETIEVDVAWAGLP